MAAKERKKALAGSVVKVTARDVMMSKKIIISIVMVPALWVAYALALLAFADMEPSTVALLFICLPIFSYAGVMTTQAGMVDLKDLKPMLMRLRPTIRAELEELKVERKELQEELRAFVKRVGPSLGPIYEAADIKWGKVMNSHKSEENLAFMATKAAHAMEPAKYAAPPPQQAGAGSADGGGDVGPGSDGGGSPPGSESSSPQRSRWFGGGGGSDKGKKES
ncbi:unnamed protein product [Phaeothamnion confervicola]